MSLRIAFVTDHTYLPDRVGGRESDIHEIALPILAAGHEVLVVARRSGAATEMPYDAGSWHAPYTIERVDDVVARGEELLREGEADVAVCSVRNFGRELSQDPMIARRQIAYVKDARQIDQWNKRTFAAGHGVLANSEFIACRIREATGASPPVIPPYFQIEKYRVAPRGEFITFINPIPEKGVELALKTAACLPDLPFLFVEGWPSREPGARENLLAALAPHPNITLAPRRHDMRSIYERTKILIVPSQWEEAFGRVAMEAQISGIPVLATRVGGLPESVGNGGLLLPREAPPEEWAAALRQLMVYNDCWTGLSLRALEHAKTFIRKNEAAPAQLVAIARRQLEGRFAV